MPAAKNVPLEGPTRSRAQLRLVSCPVATPELSDEELMVRMQADDVIAFEVLFERYRLRAHRVAGVMTSGVGSPDDVLQDAFLGVWRGRAGYRAELGSVGSWVLAIVRLRSIDAHRRETRHAGKRARAEDATGSLSDSSDIEAVVGERDRAAALRDAIGRLPASQRDVVVLAYFGELSISEIATELSLPLGTVKGRMRLGLTKRRVA